MFNEKPKSFLKQNNTKIITEESIKNDKSKYIINNRFNMDVCRGHFQIIEAFANKEIFFSDSSKLDRISKEERKEEQNDRMGYDDDLNFMLQKQNLIKQNKENNYFVADIHGDLLSLLQVLTGNEDNTKNPAQFKKGESCVIYRDVTKNPPETYNNISDYKSDELKNLVPIPNLEPNPDFQGNFIFGGDIIDRGDESESCFYALENLINENQLLGKKKKNIIYEIGNHEEFILLGDTDNSINNHFKCLNITDSLKPNEIYYNRGILRVVIKRIECMKKAMQNMLQNNTMQLIHNDNYNNIYCHAVVNKHSILNALEVIDENFSDEKLKKYFAQKNINLIQLKTLKDKIATNTELKLDDIKLLVGSLNTLAKYYFDPNCKNQEVAEVFSKNITIKEGSKDKTTTVGLLWNRKNILEFYPGYMEGINKFFVGHDPQNNNKIEIYCQHCFTDIATSAGYIHNEYTSSHIVEIDENDKISSKYQEFNREKFEEQYQKLENSLNMLVQENKQQIIKD